MVAVHDGARPLAGPALFRSVVTTAGAVGGAVPALPAQGVLPAATPLPASGDPSAPPGAPRPPILSTLSTCPAGSRAYRRRRPSAPRTCWRPTPPPLTPASREPTPRARRGVQRPRRADRRRQPGRTSRSPTRMTCSSRSSCWRLTATHWPEPFCRPAAAPRPAPGPPRRRPATPPRRRHQREARRRRPAPGREHLAAVCPQRVVRGPGQGVRQSRPPVGLRAVDHAVALPVGGPDDDLVLVDPLQGVRHGRGGDARHPPRAGEQVADDVPDQSSPTTAGAGDRGRRPRPPRSPGPPLPVSASPGPRSPPGAQRAAAGGRDRSPAPAAPGRAPRAGPLGTAGLRDRLLQGRRHGDDDPLDDARRLSARHRPRQQRAAPQLTQGGAVERSRRVVRRRRARSRAPAASAWAHPAAPDAATRRAADATCPPTRSGAAGTDTWSR